MSASFIISIDSIEFFNLPKAWLDKEEVTALDTARIKLTLIAGLRRRETFKSNPIPVSTLPLRGFGFQPQPNINSNISHHHQPLPSKVVRLTKDTAISHRFAEVTFHRVQQNNDSNSNQSSKIGTFFQTSKTIEFELRLYTNQGTERKLAIISQNSFPLSEAIKPGSFPEGVLSPKIYFKLDREEYDGASVAVMNGTWRRLQSFDAPEWAIVSSSSVVTRNEADFVSDSRNSDRALASGNAVSSSKNNNSQLNLDVSKSDRFKEEQSANFGANGVEDSFNMNDGQDRTLSWGAPTSRYFSHDANYNNNNPNHNNNNAASSAAFLYSKARFIQQQQQQLGFATMGSPATSTMMMMTMSSNAMMVMRRRRVVVVISGGARGVGATLVKMFLLAGYLVGTCDLLEFDEDELEIIKAEALKRNHGIMDYQQSKSSANNKNKKTEPADVEDDDETLAAKQRKVLKMERDEASNNNNNNNNNNNGHDTEILKRSKSAKLVESDDEDEKVSNKKNRASMMNSTTINEDGEELDPRTKILFTYRCNITDEEAVAKFVDATAKYFSEDTHWLSLVCNAAIANPYMPSIGTEQNQQSNTNNSISSSKASASSGNNDSSSNHHLQGTSALARLDITAFKNYLDVNITGSMILIKHCAKYLEPRKNTDHQVTATTFKEDDPDDEFFGGSIILMSSTRAAMSEPNCEGYAASKGAIESLCHSVAISNPRIRCNAIRLGWCNVLSNFVPSFEDHKFHPVGRVGRPSDVFQMCRFLAENELSGFVTGSVMTLDGGVTKKMIYPEEE